MYGSSSFKSSSHHHSPPLDVGLVVSTVALSAILQPREGEPGPGAHDNNFNDNEYYLNLPGAHGDAGPGTILHPPSPHEAAKKPGAETILITAESFPTAEN